MCQVDLLTGRLNLWEDDFELPGIIPLVQTRHYRSDGLLRGDVGHGWGHSLGIELWREAEDELVCRAADGRRISFLPPALGQPSLLLGEQMALALLPRGELPWPALRAELPRGAYLLDGASDFTLLFDPQAVDRHFVWRGIADRSGNLVRVQPGNAGQPARFIDPQGRVLDLVRDHSGMIAAVHLREEGRDSPPIVLVRYEYDAAKDLVAVHDAAGTRRYEYKDHRLVRHHDRCGGTCESRYDELGRCIATSGPNGTQTRTYQYDPENKTSIIRDSLGHSSQTSFNAAGLANATVDEAGGKSTFEYDDQGRLVKAIDQLGNETIIAFRPDGRQIGKIAPNGAASAVETNARGEVTRLISAAGATTAYDRDALGRVVKVARSGQGATKIQRADNGTIGGVQAPMGKKVAIQRSPNGQSVLETDAEGPLTEQTVDLLGRVVLWRDALGATMRYRYDEPRKITITNPDGSSRAFLNDAQGRTVELRDELGGVRQWTYDTAGRRVGIALPNGEVMRCEYDGEDRLTAVQTSDRLWHRYEYDARGLAVRQQFNDGRVERYEYDAVGRLSKLVDSAGGVIEAQRDPAGNLLRINYPDGSAKKIELDEAGRWLRVAWEGHTLERELSAEGQASEERQDDYTIWREFGKAGELLSALDSLGRQVTYAYDDLGRVLAIATVRGTWQDESWEAETPPRTHQFKYDRVGNLVEWIMPGGKVEKRKYDLRRRLIDQQLLKGERLVLRREYAYDALNRLTMLRDSRRGETKYHYDAVGRLRGVESQGGQRQNMDYSPAGDLLLPGVQYAPGHRVTQSPGGVWKYDDRGFVVGRGTSQGNQELSYSTGGLLQRIKKPDGAEVRYEYDAHARLLRKRAAGKEHAYHWNGDVVWATRCSAGPNRDFVYLPDTFTLLEQHQGDASYTAHTDHLGRVLELVDDDGNVVWADSSGVWGEGRSPTDPPGAVVCPLGFPGQLWDADAGLYYNRHRFYDPHTAHYLTPDPMGIWGGFDLYRYPPDPVNLTDPLGLKCRGKTDDPHVFRGDKRPPETICSEGFKPRNPSAGLSLFQHVEGVPGTGSNWISTTHDLATAENFSGEGYVYIIKNPGCGKEADCDPAAQKKYGADPPGSEHEIAFDKAIPPENILGFFKPGGGLPSFC